VDYKKATADQTSDWCRRLFTDRWMKCCCSR